MADLASLQQASSSVRRVSEELARNSRSGAALTNTSGLVNDLEGAVAQINTFVAVELDANTPDAAAAANDGQPTDPTPTDAP